MSPSTLQLDANGYIALIAAIKAACDAGDLRPPTLFRIGFHSQWIAAAVGRAYGSNGGYLRFAIEYDDPVNAGLGDAVKYLIQVGQGCASGSHCKMVWPAACRTVCADFIRVAPKKLRHTSTIHPALLPPIVRCKQLRETRFPGITYADLFSLAGSIAPEIAGGPPIAWWVCLSHALSRAKSA